MQLHGYGFDVDADLRAMLRDVGDVPDDIWERIISSVTDALAPIMNLALIPDSFQPWADDSDQAGSDVGLRGDDLDDNPDDNLDDNLDDRDVDGDGVTDLVDSDYDSDDGQDFTEF